MINKELIQRVYRRIKADEEHFNMMFFGIEKECGTVACFAGWSAIERGVGYYDEFKQLRNSRDTHQDILYFNQHLEAEALGLRGISLFHLSYWPYEIWQKYTEGQRVAALREAIINFTGFDPESDITE